MNTPVSAVLLPSRELVGYVYGSIKEALGRCYRYSGARGGIAAARRGGIVGEITVIEFICVSNFPFSSRPTIGDDTVI
jgi:hypothetical protein